MHVKLTDILSEGKIDAIHNPYDVDAPIKKDLIGINQYWYKKSDIIIKNGKKAVKPGAIPDFKTGKDGHLHPFSPKEKQDFKDKQDNENDVDNDSSNQPSSDVTIAMNQQLVQTVNILKTNYKSTALSKFPKEFALLSGLSGSKRTRAAQYIISKYNITTDKRNKKIYIGALPSSLRKSFGSELSKYILDMLHTSEVQVPINASTTSMTVVNGIPLKEFFKPTIIFNRKLRKVLDMSSEFNIDGNLRVLRIEESTYFPEKIPNSDDLFSQYKLSNSHYTDREIHVKVQRIINNIVAYNQKLQLLSTFQKFEVVDFTKIEGISVADKLGKSIISQFKALEIEKIIDDDEYNIIVQHINRIIIASTLENFDSYIGEFITFLLTTPAREVISSLIELLSAIRQSLVNYNIFIPMKDDFRLADIVCLLPSHHGITSELEKYETIQLIITTVDVKFLSGAASLMKERINYSIFDHKNTRKQLMYLLDKSFSLIFSDNDVERLMAESEIDKILLSGNNLETILKYYQYDKYLNKDPFTQIAYLKSTLVYGKRPKGGIPALTKSSIFHQNLPNKEAWKLYSLVGFIGEALYNSFVDMQLFESHTYYRSGIAVTNGFGIMSKLRFKFIKKIKIGWPPIPDIPPVATIIPTKRDNMRIN